MSLDGLRAWIGEVERKLGVRTKAMLALAAIAIGLGGAALYMAIDTRSTAVSESDVQKLQEELEAGLGAGGTTAGTAQLEAELDVLRSEVEELRSGDGASGSGKGGPPQGASSGNGTSNDSGGASSNAGEASSGGAASAGGAANSKDEKGTAQKLKELQELAEQATKAAE